MSAYATEQGRLEETEPQQQAARHRILDHYLHTSFAANQHIDSPRRKRITLEDPQPGVIPDQITNDEQAANWFTTEHPVLLAAINYAVAHGFDTHAWQLPWAMAGFLCERARWHGNYLFDRVVTQQTAVTAAQRLGDHAAMATAFREFGAAYIWLGLNNTEAHNYLHQAVCLYQDLDDSGGQADAHLSLAHLWQWQGQYTKALVHDQNSLDLYRATGDRIGEAIALYRASEEHVFLKNYQQALNDCQQALGITRDLGHRSGEADTLSNLGYIYHHLSRHDEALTCYQQALALYREFGNRHDEADVLGRLGDTYDAIGNDAAACDAWRQLIAISEDMGYDIATARRYIDELRRGHSVMMQS